MLEITPGLAEQELGLLNSGKCWPAATVKPEEGGKEKDGGRRGKGLGGRGQTGAQRCRQSTEHVGAF